MWVFKSLLFATPAEVISSFLFTALLPFFVFVKSLLGERALPLCPVQGLDAKFLMALYEKSYDLAIINIVPACHREQRGEPLVSTRWMHSFWMTFSGLLWYHPYHKDYGLSAAGRCTWTAFVQFKRQNKICPHLAADGSELWSVCVFTKRRALTLEINH